MSETEDLRALIREVIRDQLGSFHATDSVETVDLSTDEDLGKFVARLLALDETGREDLRTGRKRFRLARPLAPTAPPVPAPPAPAPAVPVSAPPAVPAPPALNMPMAPTGSAYPVPTAPSGKGTGMPWAPSARQPRGGVGAGARGGVGAGARGGVGALGGAVGRRGAAVRRVERGAVTERMVRDAATAGERLVLGRGAVLTPLAKDRARASGVEIEKER